MYTGFLIPLNPPFQGGLFYKPYPSSAESYDKSRRGMIMRFLKIKNK